MPLTFSTDTKIIDIAGTITADIPENTYGVSTGTLPKGNYAVIRHLGSYDHIKDSVYHLYRDSGYHNQRLK